MTEERAKTDHPFGGHQFYIFPKKGRAYLNWRHKKCRGIVRGKHILDAPSGEGLGLGYFNAASSITCLDYDAECLNECKSRSAKVTETICASMASIPCPKESFDCVVSLEGLEHLDKRDGHRFLSEVYRVLRNDGDFILSCPYSRNGSHSGNEFHLHEWTLSDLEELLEGSFQICKKEYSDSVGNTVWYHLRKQHKSTSTDCEKVFETQAISAVDKSFAGVRTWLASNESADRPSKLVPLWMDGEPSLLPTCFSVIAGELSGLNRHQSERSEIAEAIQSFQCEDGIFRESVDPQDLSSHSATYISMQMTYFSIHALDALGTRPSRPVDFVKKLTNINYLHGWMDGGRWEDPWLHSNNIMFALTFLQSEHLWNQSSETLKAFDSILDYLDQRQDESTGLWHSDSGKNLKNAVYAAYHFFPFYFWRGRRPQFVDKVIDSVLAIQEPGGLFGGGACEDLDAVHSLVLMSLVTDHRENDVRVSLERCLWRLLQIQNSDGGFPNQLENSLQAKSWKRQLADKTGLIYVLPESQQKRGLPAIEEWKYSGWEKLRCPLGASDSWGAWFRPLAVQLIVDRYHDLKINITAGRYRSLPGLGWHDESRIREAS